MNNRLSTEYTAVKKIHFSLEKGYIYIYMSFIPKEYSTGIYIYIYIYVFYTENSTEENFGKRLIIMRETMYEKMQVEMYVLSLFPNGSLRPE